MVVPKMAKNGFKSKKVDIANNSETAEGKNPSSNPKNQRIKAIFRLIPEQACALHQEEF